MFLYFVTRCGERVGVSFVGLALRFGRLMLSFLPRLFSPLGLESDRELFPGRPAKTGTSIINAFTIVKH